VGYNSVADRPGLSPFV